MLINIIQKAFFPYAKLGAYALLANSILIFLITIIAAKMTRFFIRLYFEGLVKRRKTHIDQTHFALISRLVIVLIYIAGIITMIYSIPSLRALSYSMLAGAGVLAVIIGFATKDTFSNFMAGIFIAIYEPIRVNDKVIIENEYGTIEDITLRHTIVKTWDHRRVVIPNSKVNNDTIINYSIKDPRAMRPIKISISYGSDIDKAKKIMLKEAMKHKDNLIWEEKNVFDEVNRKEPKVMVVELADNGVLLRLDAWAKDWPAAWAMSCDLMESIKKQFDKEGIEIAYPHRVIMTKSNRKHR